MKSTIAHLNRLLEGMVHGSVQGDRLLTLRHRQSLAVDLVIGLAGLVAVPVWLALGGPARPAEALILAWLAMPLAIAAFLSRTGRLETAHLLAIAAGTGFIVWLTCLTGGLASPVLFCLALVPIEASLSGARLVAAAGLAAAGIGFALVAAASGLGLVAPAGMAEATPVVILAALLYAGGIAFRLHGLARAASVATRRGEERYRLIADNATDMITRHVANGDVNFASPGARRLTGTATAELLGNGLFGRVHVADRPAYLKALADAWASRRETAAEFRLRCARLDGSPDEFVAAGMRCRPAINGNGSVDAVIAVTRPIDETPEAREAPARTVTPISLPTMTAPAPDIDHQLQERRSA